LLDIAQAYRKLDQLEKAREFYTTFLRDAPPLSLDRQQVTRLIAELDRAIAARSLSHRETPPSVARLSESTPDRKITPSSAAAPSAPNLVSTPSAAGTAGAVGAVADGDRRLSSRRQAKLRRYWWIFPVTAVVLAGTAVGIYFGARPPEQVGCSAAGLGCVDVGH
jgi:hypothetical protein